MANASLAQAHKGSLMEETSVAQWGPGAKPWSGGGEGHNSLLFVMILQGFGTDKNAMNRLFYLQHISCHYENYHVGYVPSIPQMIIMYFGMIWWSWLSCRIVEWWSCRLVE